MTSRIVGSLLLVSLALSGCSEQGLLTGERNSTSVPTSTNTQAGSQVRIDIFPGQVLDGAGNVRALPQTIGPYDRFGDDLNVGAIGMAAPGGLSGEVFGDLPTPWADGAQIPAEPGPVMATVLINRPNTVQSYIATTDEDGLYEAVVVASDEAYDVAVIPNDPTIAFGVRQVVFRSLDETADFDLGLGVALYGRVVTGTGSEPVQGARVRAIDPSGASSADAYTDADGWYLIRVQADVEYTVVCAGQDNGRDPLLTASPTMAEQSEPMARPFPEPSSGSPLRSLSGMTPSPLDTPRR